jgi:hypothetical protein
MTLLLDRRPLSRFSPSRTRQKTSCTILQRTVLAGADKLLCAATSIVMSPHIVRALPLMRVQRDTTLQHADCILRAVISARASLTLKDLP